MLEINKILKDAKSITKSLEKRGIGNAAETIQEVQHIYEKGRSLQTHLDHFRSEMNQSSKSIGALMKQGRKEEANKTKVRAKELKEQVKELEEIFRIVEEDLKQLLLTLPNSPHERVPYGKSADDNVTVKTHG